MRRMHLSALALALLLGGVVGCGDDEGAQPQTAGGDRADQNSPQAVADLHSKVLEPELRAIAWSVADTEESGPTKIVAFNELVDRTRLSISAADQADLNEHLSKYDQLKTDLLRNLEKSDTNEESVIARKNERDRVVRHAKASGELVDELTQKYKVNQADIQQLSTLQADAARSSNLERRLLLARTYAVDAETEKARAEALNQNAPHIKAKVNELDKQLLEVRKQISAKESLSKQEVADYSRRIDQFATAYQEALQTPDPAEEQKRQQEAQQQQQQQQQQAPQQNNDQGMGRVNRDASNKAEEAARSAGETREKAEETQQKAEEAAQAAGNEGQAPKVPAIVPKPEAPTTNDQPNQPQQPGVGDAAAPAPTPAGDETPRNPEGGNGPTPAPVESPAGEGQAPSAPSPTEPSAPVSPSPAGAPVSGDK